MNDDVWFFGLLPRDQIVGLLLDNSLDVECKIDTPIRVSKVFYLYSVWIDSTFVTSTCVVVENGKLRNVALVG